MFSRAERAYHLSDSKDERLTSPNHSRLYFRLIDAPDSVTDLYMSGMIRSRAKGHSLISSVRIDKPVDDVPVVINIYEILLCHCIP